MISEQSVNFLLVSEILFLLTLSISFLKGYINAYFFLSWVFSSIIFVLVVSNGSILALIRYLTGVENVGFVILLLSNVILLCYICVLQIKSEEHEEKLKKLAQTISESKIRKNEYENNVSKEK